MNYPMQELAIVGPILFIVLMVAFPVIGVFAGWKRAAYWGGGNLLFYIIGLVVWIFAHDPISAMVNNIITPLLQGTGITADITKIAASVAAPLFFIIVLLIGNLLLVINYFAWFKRVAKIGKFDPNNQEKDKKHKPRSVQYRIVNGVIGGVGLPLLLLPTTLSFSQAVMFTTTSATTRANNGLAAGVYNGLASVSNGVSWFSYYGYSNTLQDIDAIFSAINVATQEVTYTNLNGNPQTGTAVEGLKDVVGNGITGIINDTKEASTVEDVQPIVRSVVTSWNSLLGEDSASRTDITVMLNSENATELVEQMIGQNMTEKVTINPSDVEEGGVFSPDGVFQQTVDWYVNELSPGEQITPIEMNQGSYNNMCNMINNMFNIDNLSTEQQQSFKGLVDQMADLFFVVK